MENGLHRLFTHQKHTCFEPFESSTETICSAATENEKKAQLSDGNICT